MMDNRFPEKTGDKKARPSYGRAEKIGAILPHQGEGILIRRSEKANF
ncbi:MAG: hypothetical protein FWC38_08485 [Proteobacteria bacterium]|nr:hypothetical protein [Pseudomonadota bacterium]MCL2308237.1 hypothetical protein [Pseudomonadota bacterium]